MNRSEPKTAGRVSVRLDDDTARELDAELDRLAMSESEFVRQAIRHALSLASVFDARCSGHRPPPSDNGGDIDGEDVVDVEQHEH